MAIDTTPKQALLVAACALFDGAGRVLVQQRPPGKSMAGLWEFPGGKVDPGEAPAEALVRELHEELGIRVDAADLAAGPFACEPLGDRQLVLLLYVATRWEGEPEPLHATAIAWHKMEKLATLAMPPADGPLVTALAKLMPVSSPSS
jgi:8-oxo-dGTP diphosphatase